MPVRFSVSHLQATLVVSGRRRRLITFGSFVWLEKLLQRLLDDRRPTVELIKNEGGKVAELAESVDKEKVAKEIESLGQRWDALLKKAENRSV